MMTPTVTWLLPVKNAMPYLAESLASIESQTYRRYHVLAWDNGSQDGSAQELRRWIPSRLPGRVITDRAMGLGACLAQMVEMAQTPWCARIDGDDVNLPERLERQVGFMTEHPEVAVVGSNIRLIDQAGADQPGAWSVQTDDAEIRWRLRFVNAMNHPTVMFRRSAILEAGNYRDLMPGQDYDLWVRVAGQSPMRNLPDCLVKYRLLGSSVGARHRGHNQLHRIAGQYLSELFPELDAPQADRLRGLIARDTQASVTLADCFNLWRCATQAARRAGQRPDYFRATTHYRRQFKDLLFRWMKRQPCAAAAWPVLRKTWHRFNDAPPIAAPRSTQP